MNKNWCVSIVTLLLVAGGATRALAQGNLEGDPAYLAIDKAFDLKVIHPEVNINLPRFLLQDALSDLRGGTNDPFAKSGVNLADLVKDVKLIRLLVLEGNKTNREAVAKGIATLRSTLETKWTPVATVPEENVGIYAIGDPSGETMAGLALLVHDGDDTVIANIVGRVSLGKIVKLASQFDKFPKDLLKKLTETGGEGADKKAQAAKAEK